MKFNLFLLSAAAMVNAASGTDSVELGDAGDYAILSKAGISAVPPSIINGNIAVSPIAATAITGFGLIADSTNVFSESSLVNGQVKAANYAVPTPAALTKAIGEMEAAYTDAAGRDNFDANRMDVNGGLIGEGSIGRASDPMTAGVYTFGSSVQINGNVHFSGTSTDIFIIQMTGDLILADSTDVVLDGSAQAENIFWQIAGHVNIGKSSKMKGVLLVKTKAVFNFESSLEGRILAQTAVTLDQSTITQPS